MKRPNIPSHSVLTARLTGSFIVCFIVWLLGTTSVCIVTAREATTTRDTTVQGNCQTFQETHNSICGAFLHFWLEHDGLTQYGLPISSVFPQVNLFTGKQYNVQYFERAVLEHHPENAGSDDEVLLKHGSDTISDASNTQSEVVTRIQQNRAAVTVSTVVISDTLTDEYGLVYRPMPGYTMMLVHVVEENVTSQLRSYSRINYKLKNRSGLMYYQPSTFTPASSLSSGLLKAHEQVRGVLAFEVKQDATDLYLEYTHYEEHDSLIKIPIPFRSSHPSIWQTPALPLPPHAP